MKTIKIKDEVFEYKIFVKYKNTQGEHEYTQFYKATKIEKYKRYYLFGKTLSREIINPVFFVDFSVHDCYFSKEDLRERLYDKYDMYINEIKAKENKLKRCEEIKRGELI